MTTHPESPQILAPEAVMRITLLDGQAAIIAAYRRGSGGVFNPFPEFTRVYFNAGEEHGDPYLTRLALSTDGRKRNVQTRYTYGHRLEMRLDFKKPSKVLVEDCKNTVSFRVVSVRYRTELTFMDLGDFL